jgi:hypothetical protein
VAGIAQMMMNTRPAARVEREQALALQPAMQARS